MTNYNNDFLLDIMLFCSCIEAFTNNLKKLRAVAMSFYRGIAVLMTIGKKERKRNDKKTDSLKEVVMKSIQFLRSESNGHNWNHQNKLHLLEAGFYSYQKKKDKANLSYNAAIAMARSSGYIHEQGLACELAGMHYKKMGEKAIALSSFRQAIRCYTEWGSQVRVDMVTRQMELLEE